MARLDEVLVVLQHELHFPIRQRAFPNKVGDSVRHGDLQDQVGLNVLRCLKLRTLDKRFKTLRDKVRLGVQNVWHRHTSIMSSVCSPTDTAAYKEYAVSLYS